MSGSAARVDCVARVVCEAAEEVEETEEVVFPVCASVFFFVRAAAEA